MINGIPPGFWELADFYLRVPMPSSRTAGDWTTLLSPDVRRAVLTRASELVGEDLEVHFWQDTRLDMPEGNLGPTIRRGVKRWCPQPGSPLETVLAAGVAAGGGYAIPSLDAFYQRYPVMLQLQDSGMDEHWAERRFLEEVFVPTLGLAGLARLTPQYPLRDANGRQRHVDFVLDGAKRYAIEIEGRTYHDRHDAAGFDDESLRRAMFAAASLPYLPVTYTQICDGTAAALLRDACLADDVLRPLALEPTDGTALVGQWWLQGWPQAFSRLQRSLLVELRRVAEQGKRSLVVVQWCPNSALGDIALADLLSLLEQVAILFGAEPRDLPLPRLTSYACWPVPEAENDPADGWRRTLSAYYGAEPDGDAEWTDHRNDPAFTAWAQLGHKKVQVSADQRGWGDLQPDFVVCAEGGSQHHGSSEDQPLSTETEAPTRTDVETRRALPGGLSWRPAMGDGEVLHYFARRFFNVPNLRLQQVEAMSAMLSNRSGLVLLPTGYGKSLCFQLPAYLIPGTVLVISPLRALIRDQVEGLLNRGLSRAEGLEASDDPAKKRHALENLAAGEYRLFYLSPERLQSRTFVSQVVSMATEAGIWALAVDEAHCLSEWGHDFRPAYLQVPRFRQRLLEALGMRGQDLPLLALTATASHPVRRDLERLLDLPEELITTASADRREISLSVHPVETPKHKPAISAGLLALPYKPWPATDGAAALALPLPSPAPLNRAETLASVVRDRLPEALGRTWPALIPRHQPFTNAFLVFCIYADPHGKKNTHLGLSAARDALRKAMIVYGAEDIRLFASTPVRVCPACGDYRYYWDKSFFGKREKTSYVCANPRCRTGFEAPAPIKAPWDDYLVQTQQAYQRDEFPIMIATKSFGMGIDKSNIRGVIHYAFASGLEGYYQEIGRAARDGEHSHAALIYAPPHPSCVAEVIGPEAQRDGAATWNEPPCVTDPELSKYQRCKFGLAELCDYGRQAQFIAGNYPGVAADVERTLSTFHQLVPAWHDEPVPLHCKGDGDGDGKGSEVALYRLQQLGVIGGYTVEYVSPTYRVIYPEVVSDWSPGMSEDALRDALRRLMGDNVAERMARLDEQILGLQPMRDAAEQAWQRRELGPVEALLFEYLALLIRETYHTIKGMRYFMLREEWNYATAEGSGACRRAILRRAFDAEPKEDIRCGFCDTCVPTLQFSQKQATIPMADATLEQLGRDLPALLRRFEPAEVDQVVEVCRNKHALQGLQGFGEHALESEPGNLTAFALAGSAAAARGRLQEALRHFADALAENERAIGRYDWAEYFYGKAKLVDAGQALSLIANKDGLFDTPDGHRFLLEEARAAQDERTEVAARLVLLDAYRDAVAALVESGPLARALTLSQTTEGIEVNEYTRA